MKELRYVRSIKTGKLYVILDDEALNASGKRQAYIKAVPGGERRVLDYDDLANEAYFGEVAARTAVLASGTTKSETERCPHCDASMLVFKHTLNKPMVKALRALADAGGIANLKTLGLTRNQWDNFQKMRYLELVEQVAQDGKRKKGVWKVTDLGTRFLAGKVSIQRSAKTYRGAVVERYGKQVHVNELADAVSYRQREDYQADAERA